MTVHVLREKVKRKDGDVQIVWVRECYGRKESSEVVTSVLLVMKQRENYEQAQWRVRKRRRLLTKGSPLKSTWTLAKGVCQV